MHATRPKIHHPAFLMRPALPGRWQIDWRFFGVGMVFITVITALLLAQVQKAESASLPAQQAAMATNVVTFNGENGEIIIGEFSAATTQDSDTAELRRLASSTHNVKH